MKLINNSNHIFTDISSEEWRIYYFFPDLAKEQTKLIEVQIMNPMYLSISESGGHRILDAQGISHYIPSGWVHLSWKAREMMPHFVQ